jgi:hypothetical protein
VKKAFTIKKIDKNPKEKWAKDITDSSQMKKSK